VFFQILESGHVVIFYSAHNGNTMFFKVSREPENIASWGKGLRLKIFVVANHSEIECSKS
jgi:hypothetical protein